MSFKGPVEDKSAESSIPEAFLRQYRSFENMVRDADELSVWDKALVSYIQLGVQMSRAHVPLPPEWNAAYALACRQRDQFVTKQMQQRMG